MQKTGNRAKYKVPAESPRKPAGIWSVHPDCIEAKKELHWSECSWMQKSRESTEASFAGGELHTFGASMVLKCILNSLSLSLCPFASYCLHNFFHSPAAADFQFLPNTKQLAFPVVDLNKACPDQLMDDNWPRHETLACSRWLLT